MAQVPATSYESTSLGDVAEFTIPFPFLSRAEVFVTVDGASVPFTWINDGLVQLSAVPELGAVVRRYRSTAAYVPLHQFSTGVPFLPRYVDRDFKQTLYAVQESVNDTAGTAAQALATAEESLLLVQDAFDILGARTQYIVKGPYGPGILFETTSEVFSYLGEFYAPGPSIPLPYTTTGAGAGEIANFRSVGDATLRSDLNNAGDPTKGAALVQYKGRTVAQRLGDVVSAGDFGAIGDGVTDDTAAIQAAINSLSTGTVSLPVGTFKLTASITLKPGVSIKGAGQFATTILVATAGITAFSLVFATGSGANHSLSDFSIYCVAANVQGFKFVHANRVVLRALSFYGCLINFEFDRGGLNTVSDCVSSGTPTLKSGQAKLWSSDDAAYGCVFSTVSNYRIENNGMGVQSPAVYMRRAVAIKFSNFVTNDGDGTGTCVLIENDCQGINFNGGVVVGYALGMVFQKGGGVDKAPISNTINCVDFDQCTTNSVLMTAGENNQVLGGTITSSFVATDKVAVSLNGAAVISNTIANLFITGYFSINGTGVLMNNCSGNKLFGVTVEGCSQGLAFGAGVTGAHVSTCDFSDSVTTPVAGTFSGATNRIVDCKGFSAAAIIGTPALPASGVALTNTAGVPVRVFINGGSVSLIAINGVASGFTSGAMLLLQPGETLAVTYSTTPSWNWIAV